MDVHFGSVFFLAGLGWTIGVAVLERRSSVCAQIGITGDVFFLFQPQLTPRRLLCRCISFVCAASGVLEVARNVRSGYALSIPVSRLSRFADSFLELEESVSPLNGRLRRLQ